MALVEPPADFLGSVAIRFQYQTVNNTATTVAVDKIVIREPGDLSKGWICWIQSAICLPVDALLGTELLEPAMSVRANQGGQNEMGSGDGYSKYTQRRYLFTWPCLLFSSFFFPVTLAW